MVVGERANLRGGVRWPEWDERLERLERRAWLDRSLAVSCMRRNCGEQRRKLDGIGLAGWLDDALCLNLLPPAPCGEWCHALGASVGAEWRDWSLEQDAQACCLLGLRVARSCLGYSADLLTEHSLSSDCGERSMRVLVLPHPSGRSRWWNDRENWEEARDVVGEFLRR